MSDKIAEQIGSLVLSILKKRGKTQKWLAAEMNVSRPYINSIVKGKQNLSLSTIAKLSVALDFELICFTDFKYSEPLTK